MRTTETMTVSLPPALVRQFEEVRKKESVPFELVREALRVYFESCYPAVEATADERVALRRGRAALRKGDAVSLKAFLLHDVERNDHRSRTKGLPKASAKDRARVKAALLSMQSDPFKGDLKQSQRETLGLAETGRKLSHYLRSRFRQTDDRDLSNPAADLDDV